VRRRGRCGVRRRGGVRRCEEEVRRRVLSSACTRHAPGIVHEIIQYPSPYANQSMSRVTTPQALGRA